MATQEQPAPEQDFDASALGKDPNEQQQPQDQNPEGQQPAGDMVPKARLDEAIGKSRKYKEEVADFRRQLSEVQGMVQGFIRAQPQPQQAPEPTPVPDLYADPAGFARFVREEADRNAEHRINSSRTEMSFQFAAAMHPEKFQRAYDAANVEINQKGNAQLREALRNSQSPGFDVIRWFEAQEQQRFLREIGDPAKWQETERERIKQELLGEMQAQPAQQQPNAQQPAMPTSFTRAQNSGSRAQPQWGGPRTMSEILGR